MVVIRRSFSIGQKGGAFAKGRKAIAIDQRTGFKKLQRDMLFEPGTNYFMHKEESDGKHNLVTDKLNYISDKMKEPEAIGLKYPSLDVALSIGTIVSADSLALDGPRPLGTNFYQFYSGTSLGL